MVQTESISFITGFSSDNVKIISRYFLNGGC